MMAGLHWHRNLILSVLLLGLGTFAFWFEYSYKPKKEANQESKQKLFLLGESELKSVTLTDGTKITSVLCADKDKTLCTVDKTAVWQITQPIQDRADASNIASLLSTLNNLRATQVLDLTEDPAPKRAQLLKEYGLDKDSRERPGTKRIEIELADGKKQLAIIGNAHPISDSLYSIVTVNSTMPDGGLDETRVLLAPAQTKNQFEFDLSHWRHKKLFDITADKFVNFEYNVKGAELTAERSDKAWVLIIKKDDKWERLPGDVEAIDGFMANVLYFSAKEFAAENKDGPDAKKLLEGAQKLGFVKFRKAKDDKSEPSSMTITVYETLKGGKTDKIYATMSNLNPVFELNTTAKGQFTRTLKEFRMQKLISSSDRVMAKILKFDGGGLGSEPFSLTRDQGTWKFDGVKSADPVDGDRVSRLLDHLSTPHIKEYVKTEQESFAEQEKTGWKITVGTEDKAEKRKYLIWKRGGKFIAKDLLNHRAELFQLDDVLKDTLPGPTVSFKKAAPVTDAGAGAPGSPAKISGEPNPDNEGSDHDGHAH